MFAQKNKNQSRKFLSLGLLLVSSGLLLSLPHTAHAWSFWGFATDAAAETVGTVFKGLLYGVFVMVGWFASIAITLFEWAVNPDYISGSGGLLNRASVYTMWKFIRDFFNLFIILTLLYTAFTIVFQVAKNYKQTLLSLVLAALFVNFSFPITRVIIDVTNVPMYYFINQIGANGSYDKDYFGKVLSASRIQDVLIPGSAKGISEVQFSQIGVSQLLMAIVFLFIFSITLLVLAVMFVIRLAALVLLLIFSSVGFAASVIPGLQKYSGMWWEKLSQYALFGPAAALMLYVATQFFAEISKDNTQAQFLQAGIANSSPETAGFISSMAMFSIPIIMLWMAIGLAVSSSIVGAGMTVGLGYAAIKGAGRKTSGFMTYPARKFASGVGQGAKSRFNDSKVGKFFAGPSRAEAYGKGIGKNVGKGTPFGTGRAAQKEYKTELQKFHAQEVYKKVKENKENKINNSTLIQDLKTGDKVEKQAAALTLAENKAIDNLAVLKEALLAVGEDADHVNTIMKAASDKATGGLSAADLKLMTQSPAFAERNPDGTPKQDPVTKEYIVDGSDNFKSFKGRLKASGELNTLVEYEKAQNIGARGQDPTVAVNNALATVLGKLSGTDLGKQESIHKAVADADPKNDQLRAYLKDIANNNQVTYQDALKSMSIENVKRWQDAGISPTGKTTDEGARMREKMQQAKKETRERRG